MGRFKICTDQNILFIVAFNDCTCSVIAVISMHSSWFLAKACCKVGFGSAEILEASFPCQSLLLSTIPIIDICTWSLIYIDDHIRLSAMKSKDLIIIILWRSNAAQFLQLWCEIP